MKIRFVKLKNILSFDDVTVGPLNEELNLFVGPNNSGKTNVARALELVVNMVKRGIGVDARRFYHSDEVLGFEARIGVLFDGDDQEAIETYFALLPNFLGYRSVDWASIVGIRPNEVRSGRAEALYYKIASLLREIYGATFAQLAKAVAKGELIVAWSGDMYESPRVVGYHSFLDGIDKPITVTPGYTIYAEKSHSARDIESSHYECLAVAGEGKLKEQSREPLIDFATKVREFLTGEKDDLRVEDPDGYARALLVEALDRGALLLPRPSWRVLSVKARRLVEERILGRYGIDVELELSLLSLLLRIFATKLILMSEIRGEPIVEVRKDDLEGVLRGGKRYGGAGTDLSTFLLSLKNDESLARRKRFEEIRRKFRELHRGALDFDVSLRSLDVDRYEVGLQFVVGSKKQLPHRMVGSGSLEALNILSTVIGNENCVIILDEPALHLHPLLQGEVLNLLEDYTRGKRNQVIVITHSPYLISAGDLPRTFRFILEDGRTRIYKLGRGEMRSLYERVVKTVEQNPEIKKGLFSRGVVLVEGYEELLSLPLWLKRCDLDLERESVEMMCVEGCGGFKVYMTFMEAFCIPYIMVCDGKCLPRVLMQLKELGKLDDEERKTVEQALQLGRADELLTIAENKGIFAFREKDYRDFVKRRYGKRRLDPLTLRRIAQAEEPPGEIRKLADFIRRKLHLA